MSGAITAMGTTRRIHFCDSAIDVLQHIFDNDASTTTLIVCSTRDHYLEQLHTSISNEMAATEQETHYLLAKSIGLLSTSSRVRLAFCPTLEHLRAYISVLRSAKRPSFTVKSKKPLLAVLDPVSLHATTSEFSAQGLSRTFAATVETAAREDMDLVLSECQGSGDSIGNRRSLWNAHVPILNGSVRMEGRGVSVRSVAERWFEFKDNVAADTMNVE